MNSKVDIRSVNKFLKDKGIDPSEFKLATGKFKASLSRKHSRMISTILENEHRALVYIKAGRVVVRDMDRKYHFQNNEAAKAAHKLRNKKKEEVAA